MFIQIFVVCIERRMFCAMECVMAVRKSSRVIDFGTNRKRVCLTLVLSCPVSEILQVENSDLIPISAEFWRSFRWNRLPVVWL